MLLATGCAANGVIDTSPDLDGDGIPNILESTNDTDTDGLPNYLDPDSDGDLLADGAEDANGNGVVDYYDSSPTNADTDGDGVDDLIETTLQPPGVYWVTDPGMTPAAAGLFYFIIPYSVNGSKTPVPVSSALGLATTGGGSTPSPVDVYARASGGLVPVDLVDSFLSKIEPNSTGGTDPVTGVTCATFLATLLIDRYHGPKALTSAGDINETIAGVAPGPTYCFNLVPKPNTTIPQVPRVQVFTVNVNVLGDNGGTAFPLGVSRTIKFIVPPTSP